MKISIDIELLAIRRDELGLTAAQVGDANGWTDEMVLCVEDGGRLPQLTRTKYANALFSALTIFEYTKEYIIKRQNKKWRIFEVRKTLRELPLITLED